MNKKVIIICKMFWPFRFGNCTKNHAGNLACEYNTNIDWATDNLYHLCLLWV